ncbi:MAG: AlpA family phage regulatory protein [Mariprofundaceae bacterium]|nr:AlpA family phage regulatory protein [Mariprofundaceae bacterium]
MNKEAPLKADESVSVAIPRTLPSEGFVRIETVLAVIPISKTAWNDGIREGLFPPPVKLGTRLSMWNVADIRTLINHLSNTPWQVQS